MGVCSTSFRRSKFVLISTLPWDQQGNNSPRQDNHTYRRVEQQDVMLEAIDPQSQPIDIGMQDVEAGSLKPHTDSEETVASGESSMNTKTLTYWICVITIIVAIVVCVVVFNTVPSISVDGGKVSPPPKG
ncbi:hypothetical protein H2248_005359 [Termitomyces sp. 'cryptogamus']|nr:hypothetical protein H2248_005359 [Termitomyces sp. 'cryptogamus']